MARPKNAVPKYQHHKASGQAMIRVTLPGGERKVVYLGKYDSPESKSEYARLIKSPDLLAATSPADPTAPDITVAEVLVRFLEHAEQHYRHPDGRPTSEI
jgi:hypothetical protein